MKRRKENKVKTWLICCEKSQVVDSDSSDRETEEHKAEKTDKVQNKAGSKAQDDIANEVENKVENKMDKTKNKLETKGDVENEIKNKEVESKVEVDSNVDNKVNQQKQENILPTSHTGRILAVFFNRECLDTLLYEYSL